MLFVLRKRSTDEYPFGKYLESLINNIYLFDYRENYSWLLGYG